MPVNIRPVTVLRKLLERQASGSLPQQACLNKDPLLRCWQYVHWVVQVGSCILTCLEAIKSSRSSNSAACGSRVAVWGLYEPSMMLSNKLCVIRLDELRKKRSIFFAFKRLLGRVLRARRQLTSVNGRAQRNILLTSPFSALELPLSLSTGLSVDNVG